MEDNHADDPGAPDMHRERAESDRPTAGYAYQPGNAPAYWNFGTYWRLLAASDTTNGRSTTFDELFPRGIVAPPHVHDNAEEAFLVLECDMVFTLGDDDQEITAPPGTYVYIPPGTRHSFRCGSEISRVYNTPVPGGFDRGITANGTAAPQVEMPAPVRVGPGETTWFVAASEYADRVRKVEDR